MFRPRILLTIAAALALGFGAKSASADSVLYTLVDSNTPGYTGPYATVNVDRTSTTTATFTFTSLTNGGYTYLFIDGQMLDANLNATTFIVAYNSRLNAQGNAASTGIFSTQGTGNADGFGDFNLRITAGNSSLANASTRVVFTVTKTAGPAWNSVADVLAPNDLGNILAAHVGPWDGVSSGVTGDTMYVDHATITAVPEPSTMAIAGLGALGFAAYGLRRRTAK